jgi:hypothetical protein
MQRDVIEDRAERVTGVGPRSGLLDGFGNGDAQRTLVLRILASRSRPVCVIFDGLANTSAPQVCIIERRKGFCW